jgi:hypothetical protein
MKFFQLITLALTLYLFAGCDEDKEPVRSGGTVPEVTELRIAERWNSAGTIPQKVEAKVVDPQGPGNIAYTLLEVVSESGTVVFTDTLFDDGAWYHAGDGDVLAGDGYFSNKILPSRITSDATARTFDFRVFSADADGNRSDDYIATILFASNSRPLIVDVVIGDSLASGAPAFPVQLAASDADGISDLQHAYFEIIDPNGTGVLETHDLYNDGDAVAHGDLFADDSLFTERFDSTFAAGKKGNYSLRFFVVDNFNENNPSEWVESVYFANEAGRLLEVTMPDTMHRPPSSNGLNRSLLTVAVSDPQGAADIDSVAFYSLKPDGNLANGGLPIVMVDNGLPFSISNPAEEVGDLLADDQIYSFSLLIGNTTQTGTYTFTFFMRDRTGNRSEQVARTITIY